MSTRPISGASGDSLPCGLEQGTEAFGDLVEKRAVFLDLDRRRCPYNRADIVDVLVGIVGAGKLYIVQPSQKNFQWMVTLSTEVAKDRLLSEGVFNIKGGECSVRAVVGSTVAMQVHWLPCWVTHAAVKDALLQYGEVENIYFQKSPGTSCELTGIRVVTIKLKDPKTFPYFVPVYSDKHKRSFDAFCT